ncbi:hypothetical protein QJS66_11530 [Kocuria rhizophila]|nr:hypothetical protein QJS66_11530 [Kocuria rhizophila]
MSGMRMDRGPRLGTNAYGGPTTAGLQPVARARPTPAHDVVPAATVEAGTCAGPTERRRAHGPRSRRTSAPPGAGFAGA